MGEALVLPFLISVYGTSDLPGNGTNFCNNLTQVLLLSHLSFVLDCSARHRACNNIIVVLIIMHICSVMLPTFIAISDSESLFMNLTVNT